MASPNPRIDPARRRVWPRRIAKILLSTLACLLLVEVGLRTVLFSENPRLRKTAGKLRTADNFAHRWSPEYWKLLRLFASGERKETNYEPLLGWMPQRIVPGTYDHVEHERGNGKRPVLLYGDSFAQCVTGPDDCWEGILARSELGATHQLLNYGAGGQGFDQAFLLLRESIDNYAGENPLVILSVLVDDDLDRSILPFRGWPKPLFEIGANGELTLDGPVAEDALEYLESHPPRIRSYLWRYILHGTRLVPPATRARWIGKGRTFQEIRRLNRRILEEARAVLEEAGVEYFVLLFHGKGFLHDPPHDKWREAFLLGELERLGMPHVSSLTALERDRRASGRTVADYFILKGDGKGHYNPFGNEIVFEAIRRGLARQYESPSRPDAIDAPFKKSLPGEASFARFGRRPLPPFDSPADSPRWVLGADPSGPTELRFRLFGAVSSFSATLKLVPREAHENAGPVQLSLWRDGQPLFDQTLARDAPSVPIEVDLAGAHELTIRAASAEAPGVLFLAAPALNVE